LLVDLPSAAVVEQAKMVSREAEDSQEDEEQESSYLATAAQ